MDLFARAMYFHSVSPSTFIGSVDFHEWLETLVPGAMIPTIAQQRRIMNADFQEKCAHERREWGLLHRLHRGGKFLHLYCDVWTDGKGNGVLGVTASYNGFLPSASMARVEAELAAGGKPGPLRLRTTALFYIVLRGGHGAEQVAAALREAFIHHYQTDLDDYLCTVNSDTTGGARLVAIVLGLDSNGDCCMHTGSLLLGYGTGAKENLRKKGAIIVTPGLCTADGCVVGCAHGPCGAHCVSSLGGGQICRHGAFAVGQYTVPAYLMQRWDDLCNYLSSHKDAREELHRIQQDNNSAEVTPELAGDTRILGRGMQALQLLASMFALNELFDRNGDPSNVALTRSEWKQTALLESLIHVVDVFNRVVQVRGHGIGPFVLRLQARLALSLSSAVLAVVNIRHPVRKGTPLSGLRRSRVSWHDVQWPALRQVQIRVLAQLQVRYGVPTDTTLVAVVSDPRTKGDLWNPRLARAWRLLFKASLQSIQNRAKAAVLAALREQYVREHGARVERQQAQTSAACRFAHLDDSSSGPALAAPLGSSLLSPAEASAEEQFQRWQNRSLVMDLVIAARFEPEVDLRDEQLYAGLDEEERLAKQTEMQAADREALHKCLLDFDVSAFVSSNEYRKEWPLLSTISLCTGSVLPSCALVESFFSVAGFVDNYRRRRQAEDSRAHETIMKLALAWFKAWTVGKPMYM